MQTETFKESAKTIFKSKQDALSSIRRQAWDLAWQMGAPTRKTETFRYLNLKSLWDQSFSLASGEGEIEPTPYLSNEAISLVLQNGVYQQQLSQGSSDVEIWSLNEALNRYGILLINRQQKMLSKEPSFFGLLNKALQGNGLFVYIPPGREVSMPLQLLQLYGEKSALVSPRIQIFVGAGSKVQILKQSIAAEEGVQCINEVCDITLEEGAHCKLVRVGYSPNNFLFSHLRVSQKKDSQFSLWNHTKEIKTARDDVLVELLGEGADASIKGVWNLKEAESLHTQIRIEHIAPHTTSTQHYKGIVAGHSRASFEGQIYVEAKAQKTNAYQLCNHLILDEGAAAFSKPNLEIFADDVKASHGATTTELSSEELFYLQARGLPLEAAKKLLTRGFLHFFVNEIPFKVGKEMLLRSL